MRKMIVLGMCLLYAALNVIGAAMIKNQVKGTSLLTVQDFLKFVLNANFILAFSLICISALVMIKTLSMGNFTYVIPVAQGINFCLTIFVGVVIFSDILSLRAIGGLLFIILGIILVSI